VCTGDANDLSVVTNHLILPIRIRPEKRFISIPDFLVTSNIDFSLAISKTDCNDQNQNQEYGFYHCDEDAEASEVYGTSGVSSCCLKSNKSSISFL
jgi:hypothetical protein